MTKYISLNYSLLEDDHGYPNDIGLSCQYEFLDWVHKHPFEPKFDYFPNSPEDGPSEDEFSENGYYSAEEKDVNELINHMNILNYPEGVVKVQTEEEYKRAIEFERQEYEEYMSEQSDPEHDMGEMYGVPYGATPEEALKHFE